MRVLPRIQVLFIAIVLLGTAATWLTSRPGGAEAVSSGPTLVIDSAQPVGPRTYVVVRGSGYAPLSRVLIRWSPMVQPNKRVLVQADGTFTTVLTSPAIGGTFTLTAMIGWQRDSTDLIISIPGVSTPTPTRTATNTPAPTQTNTMTPAAGTSTATNTPVPPTNTATNTAIPPTATNTNTPVPPTNTATATPTGPTATPTATPTGPTATPTNTPVPPTATRTNTPIPPTATRTNTATATATRTNTPIPPTATRTNTPVAPTATPTGSTTPSAGLPDTIMVGYFPIWMPQGGFTSASIDYSAVNVVAHFAVIPGANGSIIYPDWGPFPDASVVTSAHNNGAKVILVVGGAGYEATTNFSAMAANPTARALFVSNLVALVNAQGYDGVDLDWEFPYNATDRANLKQLVTDLRAALGSGKILALATPASNWFGQWQDFSGMLPYIDWYGVMTYSFAAASWSDVAGHNSALYSSDELGLDAAMNYYLGRGVPKSKLLIGIPFFGERFDGASQPGDALVNRDGGLTDYKVIAGLIGNGWTKVVDNVAKVPYLTRVGTPGFITYDDEWSIGLKCDYMKAEGYRGAIIWHLGEDLVSGSQPLLTASASCLDGDPNSVAQGDGKSHIRPYRSSFLGSATGKR